ncbi:MAG: hypothetical protein JXN60_00505, partial [Lentisphaerae bacterium]|nr:hypothetical protein [Lentisphaerota bacterium]
YKILQLILVGQMELLPRISRMSNFWDRIALKYVLNPLDRTEVKRMLNFRLKSAGYIGENPLFTDGAIDLIWEHTQGYPRKLALLCHNSLEALVMYDKSTVDESIVRKMIDAEIKPVVFDHKITALEATGDNDMDLGNKIFGGKPGKLVSA